jgi:hypothetical protein
MTLSGRAGGNCRGWREVSVRRLVQPESGSGWTADEPLRRAGAAARIPLTYVVPIDIMVGLSTVLQMTLITWNAWYGRGMWVQSRGAAGRYLVPTTIE